MKSKIFLALLILTCAFGVSSVVYAQTMTEAQRQALIAQIQQQIALLTQQIQQMLAQQQGTAGWCYTFNSSLGTTSTDIIGINQLHNALQREGISYSPDGVSIYSAGTIRGVIQFQVKYGITPASGYVGIKTRTKLNQLHGCRAGQTSCTPSWQTGAWSACASGSQTRTVTDSNNCGVTTSKPAITQSCTVKPIDITANNSDGPVNIFLSIGNGAVVHGEGFTLSQNINLQWTGTGVSSCVASDTLTPDIFSGYKTSSSNQTAILSGDIQGALSTSKVTGTFKVTCVSTTTGASVSDSVTVNLFYTANSNCAPYWQCSAWSACASSQQTRTCTDTNGCGSTVGKPAITQSCTPCAPSWQTGAWSACVSGSQTRTVTDSNSCGITTGKPVATQSCTIEPIDIKVNGSDGPVNTFLTLGNGATVTSSGITLSENINLTWTGVNVSSCVASDTVTPDIFSGYQPYSGSQTVNFSGNIATASSKVTGTFKVTCVSTTTGASVSDSVTVNLFYTVIANCTPSWQCGVWGACSNSQQTRTCTDTNGCGSTVGKPAITQTCTPCAPNWQTGVWSACTSGSQTRTATDSNNCGVTTGMPSTTQTCTVACTPNWQTGSWGTCTNSQQTRTVTDSNNCGVTTSRPGLTQSCINPTCPSGTSWNANSSLCVGSPTCPSGTSFYIDYMNHGACFGNPTCPSGTSLQVIATPVCFGAIYTQPCPSGLGWSGTFNQCTASPRCPSGATLYPGGTFPGITLPVCYASPTCPSGTTLNSSLDSCTGAKTACPSGTTLNSSLNLCTPTSTLPPSGCSSPSCLYNGQCYPNGTVQGNYKCVNGNIVQI